MARITRMKSLSVVAAGGGDGGRSGDEIRGQRTEDGPHSQGYGEGAGRRRKATKRALLSRLENGGYRVWPKGGI
jgi:hypothetical protein